MKATCWMGKQSVEVRDVPDPKILNPRDAIVKIHVDRRDVKLNFVELFQITTITSSRTSSTTSLLPRSFQR